MRAPGPAFLMLAALSLAACGTPQERCAQKVTRDLRILDRLIAGLEVDIGRGYTLVTETQTRTRWVYCDPPQIPPPAEGEPPAPPPQPRLCLEDEDYTVERPEAIDVVLEKRKLAGLRDQRVLVNRQAAAGVAQCRVQFPEPPGAAP